MARFALMAAAAALILVGLAACSGVRIGSSGYYRAGWHDYYGRSPFDRCCRYYPGPIDPDFPDPPEAVNLPVIEAPDGGFGGDFAGDFGGADLGGMDFD